MILSIFNFKKLIYAILIIGVIIFYYNIDSVKAQSVLGDLRLSVYEASKLSKNSIDTLLLGTSITHRALSLAPYEKVSFPGHSVIDALNFVNERNIEVKFIVVEINLLDSYPKGLSIVDDLMEKSVFSVPIRLSDKLIGLINGGLNIQTKYDSKDSISEVCSEFNPYPMLRNLDLIKTRFSKDRIIFLSIPMHHTKEKEYFLKEKENLLKDLGFKVYNPRIDNLYTTDGIHMTKESAELFSQKFKLNDVSLR